MFNITKVNKELRGSHTIRWYRTDEVDYVTNGYFIIKADLRKQEYRKLLGLLVEKFGAIPESNKGLNLYCDYKGITITDIHSCPDWIDVVEKRKTEIIEDTKLIYIENGCKMRVFKGKDYIYVDIKYLEMVDEDWVTKYEGERGLEPICLSNEEDLIMALPVRVHTDNEYLIKEKDLSSGN